MGTTGDAPPFSLASHGEYVGIDIDLARDLANELGRPVEFVETTWTTLIRDAVEHRFDVAMSCINVLPSRSMFVDFSRPYDEQDYSAIVRCSERARFATLEDLDRSDVTVIVRQGAAPAIFAMTRLHRADVRQLRDVSNAYDRLVNGEGDVLIASPFRLQEYPELCLGLGSEPFWSVPVAVLLPRNSFLTHRVSQWLTRRLEDGTVQTLLEHYGAP